MSQRYVLDSYAIIALLRDEKGAKRLSELLNSASEGKREVFMNEVNLGEVYYILYRNWGREIAQQNMTMLLE